MPPNFHNASPYRAMPPGAQGVSDYGLPPNYGRPPPSHPQGDDYYYPPDQRRAPPPPTPPPYSSYPDRRARTYSDQNSRLYPSERAQYSTPYGSPDMPPNSRHSSETRPPTSQHSGHPQLPYGAATSQSVRRSPQELNPRGGPYYYQEPTPGRAEISNHSQHINANTLYSSERRESRHSINALLSEEGRRPSLSSASRPGSEASSSMGRSASMGHGEPLERDVMDDVTESVRLPPLRHNSSGERNPDGEQPPPRSNSNLWKLVSAATEQ